MAGTGEGFALDEVLDHFAAVGQDVVYVNLTSPDLEPLGLHTARAVLPGFQPIWFGHQRSVGSADGGSTSFPTGSVSATLPLIRAASTRSHILWPEHVPRALPRRLGVPRRTSRWPFNMHDLNAPTGEAAPFKEDPTAETVALPPPALPDGSLATAIAGRTSCRQFRTEAIALAQLGDVLHAGYGVLGTIDLWGEFCERPVPSGGGLYPLELYALTQRVDGLPGGAYHYVPLTHALEVVRPDPLPSLLTAEMFLGQPYLSAAAAVIVLTAVVERRCGSTRTAATATCCWRPATSPRT